MPNPPTPVQIQAISEETNPTLRNLQITQCYFELSGAMTQRLGQSANWCTFATWASKQAGQTIRQEDLKKGLEHVWGPPAENSRDWVPGDDSKEEAIKKVLRETISPEVILHHASEAVAKGNKKVFVEIGLEFARFIEWFGADQAADARKIDHFVQSLRPGPPPVGQGYLRQAFATYYQAFWETDHKKKAELLLLANIGIGFHEQTRLQPEIAEALNAGIPNLDKIASKVVYALFPKSGWWIHTGMSLLGRLGVASPLSKKIRLVLDTIRLKIRTLLTRYLMTLGLPGGKYLLLGADLKASYPESLQQLKNPELLALLSQVDPTPNNLAESRAVDWANLSDRLHYIADLFRCYQEDRILMDPPFNATQQEEIKRGVVPEGEL
jgi:hypothetical protein